MILPTGIEITYNKDGNIKKLTSLYDNDKTINKPIKTKLWQKYLTTN